MAPPARHARTSQSSRSGAPVVAPSLLYSRMRAAGSEHVWLEMHPTNERAKRFCARLGFRELADTALGSVQAYLHGCFRPIFESSAQWGRADDEQRTPALVQYVAPSAGAFADAPQRAARLAPCREHLAAIEARASSAAFLQSDASFCASLSSACSRSRSFSVAAAARTHSQTRLPPVRPQADTLRHSP